MKTKHLFSIMAILSFINGTLYLLAPEWCLKILGGETNAIGLLNTHYFGAAALGMGVMAWLARDIPSWKTQRIFVIGFLITLGAMAVAGITGTLSGTFNAFGWLPAGIDSLLFIGFIITLMIKHGPD